MTQGLKNSCAPDLLHVQRKHMSITWQKAELPQSRRVQKTAGQHIYVNTYSVMWYWLLLKRTEWQSGSLEGLWLVELQSSCIPLPPSAYLSLCIYIDCHSSMWETSRLSLSLSFLHARSLASSGISSDLGSSINSQSCQAHTQKRTHTIYGLGFCPSY